MKLIKLEAKFYMMTAWWAGFVWSSMYGKRDPYSDIAFIEAIDIMVPFVPREVLLAKWDIGYVSCILDYSQGKEVITNVTPYISQSMHRAEYEYFIESQNHGKN